MAFKLILLLTRKPGLSREQFRIHYETVHIPLLYRELTGPTSYKRNYLGENLDDSLIATPYDVISELIFDDATSFVNFWHYYRSVDLDDGELFHDDFEKFVDTTKMAHCIVMDTVEGETGSCED